MRLMSWAKNLATLPPISERSLKTKERRRKTISSLKAGQADGGDNRHTIYEK